MGRHSSAPPRQAAGPGGPARPTVRTRRPRRHRTTFGLAILVTLAFGCIAAWAGVANGRLSAPWASSCSAARVRVAAAPEIADAVRRALTDRAGRATEPCSVATVVSAAPAALARASGTVSAARWPQIWVPDSSLWVARAPGFAARPAGSLATSPVVLATNEDTATALGWDRSPPSWAGALRGARPVVLPALDTEVRGLAAFLALGASLGGGPDADRAVAAAALASARGGEAAPDAVANIPDSGADAPLVPLSEQQVVASDRRQLVAVYPTDGSPTLDYPVLRIPAAVSTDAERAAVDAVIDVLSAARLRELVGRAGFRDASGTGRLAATRRAVTPVPMPDARSVQALLFRLQQLAEPTRLLALLDVSTSMNAPAGGGRTRVQVLREAAIDAVALMRPQDQVGAWAFAARRSAGRDYVQTAEVLPLRTPENGATHRETLVAALDRLPSDLSPGGTGLYRTVRDAVLAMQKTYDPKASNVVVLLTDGRNDVAGGPSLSSLLATLRRTADPKRPVRVIAVGISKDADMAALTRIAAATPGGRAYLAARPATLKTVLLDALTNR